MSGNIGISIDDVFSDANITHALECLSNKHDGCGLDGVKLSELDSYWDANRDNILNMIRGYEYVPGVVSVKEILQPSGKRRMIA